MKGVFSKRSLDVLELMITRLRLLSVVDSAKKSPEVISLQKETEVQITSVGLIEDLTRREQEVLAALVEGMSNKEIAIDLGITEATVKTHVFNVYGKLGVKRRGQAIVRAKEWMLLED
jgi:ATP/maltotriose-dependent transcriptional regulator MalT